MELVNFLGLQLTIDEQDNNLFSITQHLSTMNQQLTMIKHTIDQHAVFATIDLNGRLTDANTRLVDISGYNKQELLSPDYQLFNKTFPPYQATDEIMNILNQNQIWHGEIGNRNKNGDTFILSATIMLNPIPKQKQYFFIGTDITSHYSRQQQLQLLTTALDSTADGVLIANKAGQVEWINPAYSKITGYSNQDIIGQHTRMFKSDKNHTQIYKNLWDTILAGKVWKGEIWNRHRSGHIYLTEQCITPMFNIHKQPQYFISILRDITDKHHLQQRLEQAHRMDSISTMTGGIAHNFNNKLAVIMGFTELAQEKCQQLNDAELSGYLQEIYQSGTKISKTINQLLSFSREKDTEHRPVQLLPEVLETIKILPEMLPSSIEITSDLENNLAAVFCDPAEIRQMILALASNARDAMNGMGILHIKLHQTNIKKTGCHACHADFAGNYIQLQVSDTGCGISPDKVDQVFLPFFTTKCMATHSGMGLSLLHGIMHKLNGHIMVNQNVPQGTIFQLYFPRGEMGALN
ncbi:MAG: PAS domain S-box protein [Gammaproteobacteria bacterium]|nr:PAS domain S-box protein [Gammaproteobacteria bacterium]